MTGRITLLVCGAVLVAACGEQPLGRVGDLSREVIHGAATTTTVPSVVVPQELAVRPSTETTWHNDGLSSEGADSQAVLAAVWRRGNGVQSFIQAARTEILTALPQIRFPAVVPSGVQFITSQLVFDPETGQLDGETSAAFGMWSTSPYSVSRSAGQVAVLRVGLPESDDTSATIRALGVAEGLSLTWRLGPYRYELFCRGGVAEAACWNMAEAMAPLPLP